MNQIDGVIKTIKKHGDLHFVTVVSGGQPFQIMTLQLDTVFEEGREVTLLFKETEVTLGKGCEGALSIANILHAVIADIRRGTAVTEVALRLPCGMIRSIITTDALKAMALKPFEKVSVLIKATDIAMEAR